MFQNYQMHYTRSNGTVLFSVRRKIENIFACEFNVKSPLILFVIHSVHVFVRAYLLFNETPSLRPTAYIKWAHRL